MINLINISEIQTGDELNISLMIVKIFKEFIAYEYNEDGQNVFFLL